MQYELLPCNSQAPPVGRRIAHLAQLNGSALTASSASAGITTMKGLSMKSASTFVAATLAGALCLWATTNAPAANWSAQTMKPLMAASFDAASNHIVGFFVNANGLCKLTLMVGDAEKPNAPTSRLLLIVDPGRSARFDADDGNTLQFACRSGATAMTATSIKSVAAAPVEE